VRCQGLPEKVSCGNGKQYATKGKKFNAGGLRGRGYVRKSLILRNIIRGARTFTGSRRPKKEVLGQRVRPVIEKKTRKGGVVGRFNGKRVFIALVRDVCRDRRQGDRED